MSDHWIKRERSPKHRCRLPILWPWVHEGSEWACGTCHHVMHVHREYLGDGLSRKAWHHGYFQKCGVAR